MNREQLKAYYAKQQHTSKQKRADVKSGKISHTEYLQYYYSIPYRLRTLYGVPKKAPKLNGV